jgi:hypothetical protein
MDHRSDSEALARKQSAAWRARGPATGVTLDDVRRMDLVQLATLIKAVPKRGFDYLYELKYDALENNRG